MPWIISRHQIIFSFLYVEPSISFQTFFAWAFKIVVDPCSSSSSSSSSLYPGERRRVRLCNLDKSNDIRGEFNMFSDFFVQAFKIVLDSWKLNMLLLYILWDDWLIFMISTLNQQLQQQLEYTLLKTDCHSWWIAKMQSGREDTLEERYAIKFCLKLGKKGTETTHGMLQTTFQPSCMNRASVFEWHKRFKEGRQSVRDDERCGRSMEVNTPELIGQRVRVRVTMLSF